MIEIRLLGAFDIRRDGEPIEVSGARARTIVALLALADGRPVTFDKIADCIWTDDAPVHVRASLHTAIRRLRRVLGDDAIISHPAGYALAEDRTWVDVLEFESRATRVLGEGPAAGLADVHSVLGLWRGAAFGEGYSDSLLAIEAPVLEETHLATVELRVDLELRSGSRVSGALVSELRALTLAHPLRESLRARLIRTLVASGRAAEGVVEYERIRRVLGAELGTGPSAALERACRAALDASCA